MTRDDAAYDDYLFDQHMEALYAQHRDQPIGEFTIERLQSYFVAHPRAAQPAIGLLNEARALLAAGHPRASLLLAAACIELGVKAAHLQPVVYGLVHSESAAGLVTNLVMKQTGIDRFSGLLLQVICEYAGVDLLGLRRMKAEKSLWDVQDDRNRVLHRGEEVQAEYATRAVAVASAVLEDVFPRLIGGLQLHLHEGVRVCDSFHIPEKLEAFRLRGPDDGPGP